MYALQWVLRGTNGWFEILLQTGTFSYVRQATAICLCA